MPLFFMKARFFFLVYDIGSNLTARREGSRDLETVTDTAQLVEHLYAVFRIGRALDLDIEIILP